MRTNPDPRIAAVLVLAVLSGGCYAYRPLQAPTPRIGTEVQADLATSIDVQLGDFTVHDVNSVEGIVYRAQGDSVIVWGSWVTTRSGSRYSANGGALLLDRQHLGSLRVRRLSLARSGAAAVIAAGVVFALFRAVDAALGGSGPSPPGPDPY